MSEANTSSNMSEALISMLGFLETDPNNLSLLSDTAELAIEEKQPKTALMLLDRYADTTDLPEKELGMLGLASMQTKEFEKASEVFSNLLEEGHDNPSIRFNCAWSLAMIKKFDEAIAILDDETLTVLPQAAMLHLQILHDQGEFDLAAEKAREYFENDAEHSGLNAAISVLALDVEDVELAKSTALKAGDHPDALTTLGTLALGEDDGDEALALFDKAMAINPHGPRTWIGKGLAHLVKGENDEALKNIDQGAEMFGTHIGSWIAAGWAHFVKDDLDSARERFERALKIDPNFAESHGSLAVIDVIQGNLVDARRNTRTALKLDNECFSATLAQVLMLSSNGNTEKAQQIFERAIHTPIDDSGRTISRSMTRMGLSTPTLH